MPLDTARWYHVAGIFALLAAASFLFSPETSFGHLAPETGTVAVLPIEGTITYGDGVQQNAVSPEEVAERIQQAKREGADAYLFELDSGGGEVVASKDLARTVEQLEKPTVCRMRSVTASGAYWVASACDMIVADSLTTTGSIGVSSAYLEVSELLNRLGVDYVNLTAGRYKDMGVPYKNVSVEERERFQDILDTVHTAFIESVAENRNLSVAQVRSAATGEVFLGREAKRLGLVDRLGGREEAEQAMKNMTGFETLKTREYAQPRTLNLLSRLSSSIGEGIVTGLKNVNRGTAPIAAAKE